MLRMLRASPRRLLFVVIVVFIVLAATLFVALRKGTDSSFAQVGEKLAPAMTLPTLDGQDITLPSQADQVTVLFTMGYWCNNCIPGAKTLARLQRVYAQHDVRFVAVDITPNVTPHELPTFLDAIGSNQLEWAMDASGHFSDLYGITALDTAIVLDRQGHEVYRNYQGESDSEIRVALDKLLAS